VSPHPAATPSAPSLLVGILSDLNKICGYFRLLCVARRPGEGAVAGRDKARNRRSRPLLGYAAILSRWLAETSRFPLCSVSSRRRVKNACCKHMFQVFQMLHRYAAKVDRDVVYVAMVHICCKLLFLMFYLFFRRILQVCLS
jgi:hypothetical protein